MRVVADRSNRQVCDITPVGRQPAPGLELVGSNPERSNPADVAVEALVDEWNRHRHGATRADQDGDRQLVFCDRSDLDGQQARRAASGWGEAEAERVVLLQELQRLRLRAVQKRAVYLCYLLAGRVDGPGVIHDVVGTVALVIQ